MDTNNTTTQKDPLESIGFKKVRETETFVEWRKAYKIVRFTPENKRFNLVGSPTFLDEELLSAMTEYFKTRK